MQNLMCLGKNNETSIQKVFLQSPDCQYKNHSSEIIISWKKVDYKIMSSKGYIDN